MQKQQTDREHPRQEESYEKQKEKEFSDFDFMKEDEA